MQSLQWNKKIRKKYDDGIIDFFQCILESFLFIMRMALFFHCQTHPPVYVLTGIHILIIQILNTVVFFVVTSVICISFSSNLQKAEQHLMLYNIELQQQAGTDPLTTLYNRRRMEEVLKNHIRANPNENFSIAIGDIDFFKKNQRYLWT